MGLLNEVIGAVVAEEALSSTDPNAGFLKKAMAAVAGFEGEKFVEEKINEHRQSQQIDQANATRGCPEFCVNGASVRSWAFAPQTG